MTAPPTTPTQVYQGTQNATDNIDATLPLPNSENHPVTPQRTRGMRMRMEVGNMKSPEATLKATLPLPSQLQTPTLPAAIRSPVQFEYSPNSIEQRLLQHAIDSSWFQADSELETDVQNPITPPKFGPPRQLFQSPLDSPHKASTPVTHDKKATESPKSPTHDIFRSSKKRARTDSLQASTLVVSEEELSMQPTSPTKKIFPIVLDASTIDLTESLGPEAVNTSAVAESDISIEIPLELEGNIDFLGPIDLPTQNEAEETQIDTQRTSRTTPSQTTSKASISTPSLKSISQLAGLMDTDPGFTRRCVILLFAILIAPNSCCRYEDLINFSTANKIIGDEGLSESQALTDCKNMFRKLVNMKRLSKASKRPTSTLDRQYQFGHLSPLRGYHDIIPQLWRRATGGNLVFLPDRFPLREDLVPLLQYDDNKKVSMMELVEDTGPDMSASQANEDEGESLGPTEAEINDAINNVLRDASKSTLDIMQQNLNTSTTQATLPLPDSGDALEATLPLPQSLRSTLPLSSYSENATSLSNAPTQPLTESQIRLAYGEQNSATGYTQDASPTLPLPTNLSTSASETPKSQGIEAESSDIAKKHEAQAPSSTTASNSAVLDSHQPLVIPPMNGEKEVPISITDVTQNVTHLVDKAQYDDNPFLAQAAARFAAKTKDASPHLSSGRNFPHSSPTVAHRASTNHTLSQKENSAPNTESPRDENLRKAGGASSAANTGSEDPSSKNQEEQFVAPLSSHTSTLPLLSTSSNLLRSILSAPPSGTAMDSFLRSAKQKRNFYSVPSSTPSTHSHMHSSTVNNRSLGNPYNSAALASFTLIPDSHHDTSAVHHPSSRDTLDETSDPKLANHGPASSNTVAKNGPSISRQPSHGYDEFDRLPMSMHYSLVDTGYIEEDEERYMFERETGVLEFDPDLVPYSAPHNSYKVGSKHSLTSSATHSTEKDGAIVNGAGEIGDEENEFMHFGLNSQFPHARRTSDIWTAIEDPDTDGISSTQKAGTSELIDDIESSQEAPSASMVPSVDDRDELDRDLVQMGMSSQLTQRTQRASDHTELGHTPSSAANLRNRFISSSQAHNGIFGSTQPSTQPPRNPLHSMQITQNAGLSARASQKGKRSSRNKKSVYTQEISARLRDTMEPISDDEPLDYGIDMGESQRENFTRRNNTRSPFAAQQERTEAGLNVSIFDGDSLDTHRASHIEEIVEEFSVEESLNLRSSSTPTPYSPYELVANAKKSAASTSPPSAAHPIPTPVSPTVTLATRHLQQPNDRIERAPSPYTAGSSRSFLKPQAPKQALIEPIEAFEPPTTVPTGSRLLSSGVQPSRSAFRFPASMGNTASPTVAPAPQTNAPPPALFARSRYQITYQSFVSPMGFAGAHMEPGLRATILATFALPFTLSTRTRPSSSTSAPLNSFKRNFSQAVADVEAAARAKKDLFFTPPSRQKFQLSTVRANESATQCVALHEVTPKHAPRKRALAALKTNNKLVWIDLEPFADEIHPGQVITLHSSLFVASSSVSSSSMHTILENALSTLSISTEHHTASLSTEKRSRLSPASLQHFRPMDPSEYFPPSQESDQRMNVDADEPTAIEQSATQRETSLPSKWDIIPCSIPIIAVDAFQDRSSIVFRDIDDYTLPVSQDWTNFSSLRRVSCFGRVSKCSSIGIETDSTRGMTFFEMTSFRSSTPSHLAVPPFVATKFEARPWPVLLDFLLQVSPTLFVADGFTHATFYSTESPNLAQQSGQNAGPTTHVTLLRRDASIWSPTLQLCSPSTIIKYKAPNSPSVCREALSTILDSLGLSGAQSCEMTLSAPP